MSEPDPAEPDNVPTARSMKDLVRQRGNASIGERRKKLRERTAKTRRPPPLNKRAGPPPLPEKRQRLKRLNLAIRNRKTKKKETTLDLQPLQNLFFEAKQIVEGMYSGRHRSPFKGSSPEFIEYRSYAPGDPVDSIDWKAYARTDRDMIRLTEKETDLTATLLVDASRSMNYGGMKPKRGLFWKGDAEEQRETKFDYARKLAGALAFLLVKQSDKVSLGIFSDMLEASIPSGGSFPHLYRVLHTLESHVGRRGTDIAASLREVRHLLKRRGLLVLISDFYVDPETLFGALHEYLHRGFEVLLLQVLHPDELALPETPNVQFIGLEDQDRLNVNVDDLRKEYGAEIRRHIDAIRQQAQARGIDHVLCSTDTPCELVLRDYVLRRSAVR